ncbi:GNAT family N-acetyltransferase [soil metagenome]
MQSTTETSRLLLNKITTDDHEFLHALVNSKGWLEFIGDRNVHTSQDAVDYINNMLNKPDAYYWVARTKDNNTAVGIISFLKRDYPEHFDIGFAFLPEFTGKGYAFEAAKEVLQVLTASKKYDPVIAVALSHNQPSIKLLHKLGLSFRKEIINGNDLLHLYSN